MYPLEHEKLPKPIITDLVYYFFIYKQYGNGQNVIVTVTPDYKIRILKYHEEGKFSEDLLHYEILHEAYLVSNGETIEGHYPVGLETGYIDPYKATESRKQVIVVVTNNWSVFCFDSELKMLWENTVSYMEDALSLGPLYHKEISITISPMSIQKEDRGTVFVGGSMELKSEEKDPEGKHDGFINSIILFIQFMEKMMLKIII